MKKMDLRVEKTYKALIENFEALLQENKFEEISVTQLCEAAMIRRPTFYKHFLDKYDFLTFFIKHKMNKIFDKAFSEIDKSSDKSSLKEYEFFILVFKQLLNQFDNLLNLIFSLQMNSDIIVELEGIKRFGQTILKNHVSIEDDDISLNNDYKAQIIMGITIQSVFWYKNHSDTISQKEIIELYTKTIEKLW